MGEPDRRAIVAPTTDPLQRGVNVVYDGAAGSGKTATLRRLSKLFDTVHRSDVVSTDETQSPTQFFDWMRVDLSAGDAIDVRAHFITVPGGNSHELRRDAIVGLADAVVFLVESTAEGVVAARPRYAKLMNKLGPKAFDERVIIQAHQQDRSSALEPEHVRRLLGGRPRVVAASLDDPVGVLTAARAAIELALEHGAGRRRNIDPGELLRLLVQMENDAPGASRTLVPPRHDEAPPRPRPGAPRHRRSSTDLETARASGVRPLPAPPRISPHFPSDAAPRESLLAPRRPRAAVPPNGTMTISARIETALVQSVALEGVICAAVVDYASGEILGMHCVDEGTIDVAVAAQTSRQVVSSKMALIEQLGLRHEVEDVVATTGSQVHVLRPLERMGTLFLFVAVQRTAALDDVREQLTRIERELSGDPAI